MDTLTTTLTQADKTMRTRPVAYTAFRDYLRTGDIALSRPDARPSNALIALGTGSPYVHATMLGWCGGVLMLAEARQWSQSHLVTLSSQVKRWPGFYDVYRVRRPFRPTAAWTVMLRATGTPYGWGQLLGDAAPASCSVPWRGRSPMTRRTTIPATARGW